MLRLAISCLLTLAALPLTGCIIVVHDGPHHWKDHHDHEYKDRDMSAESSAIPEIEPPVIHTDGRYRFSAQPDEGTLLGEIEHENVTTVINFRRESEMDERVPFDERDIVVDAGARYVHIPLGGDVGEEPGYDPEDVDRLAEVLEESEGNVLMHCASGGRARTIYTAYLIKHEGLSEEEAKFRAQEAGQQPSALDRLLGRESRYTPPPEDD